MAPNPVSSVPSVTRYDAVHELQAHLAYGSVAPRAMVTQDQSTATQEVEAEIGTSQAAQGMHGLHAQMPHHNKFGLEIAATVVPRPRRGPHPPPPPPLPAPHPSTCGNSMRELNGAAGSLHNNHSEATEAHESQRLVNNSSPLCSGHLLFEAEAF